MNFIETTLPGVIEIQPKVISDTRGFFMETWHACRFSKNGIDATFVQDNFSQSVKGTLRGIHYQIGKPQGKLISVVEGSIFDVAVDLRKSSPNFGNWVGLVLSGDNKSQLWVPPGFGHGFLVLSEIAQVDYKCTDFYDPDSERSILWNDPDIDIKWPIHGKEQPIISGKDKSASYLRDAETFK